MLNAIRTLIEKKSESKIYKTIPEQRKRIKEGRAQIAKGEFFSNEQVEMEIDKWLAHRTTHQFAFGINPANTSLETHLR